MCRGADPNHEQPAPHHLQVETLWREWLQEHGCACGLWAQRARCAVGRKFLFCALLLMFYLRELTLILEFQMLKIYRINTEDQKYT